MHVMIPDQLKVVEACATTGVSIDDSLGSRSKAAGDRRSGTSLRTILLSRRNSTGPNEQNVALESQGHPRQPAHDQPGCDEFGASPKEVRDRSPMIDEERGVLDEHLGTIETDDH